MYQSENKTTNDYRTVRIVFCFFWKFHDQGDEKVSTQLSHHRLYLYVAPLSPTACTSVASRSHCFGASCLIQPWQLDYVVSLLFIGMYLFQRVVVVNCLFTIHISLVVPLVPLVLPPNIRSQKIKSCSTDSSITCSYAGKYSRFLDIFSCIMVVLVVDLGILLLP